MLGSGKTGAIRALVLGSSVPSRDADLYRRCAAGLFRETLLTRGDPVLAEHVACDVIVTEAALARIPERSEDGARYRLTESVLRRCQQLAAGAVPICGLERRALPAAGCARGRAFARAVVT
jgi:hypothetical protein